MHKGKVMNTSIAILSKSNKNVLKNIMRDIATYSVNEKAIIYLNISIEVTRAHFPWFKTSIMQVISGFVEVKGAAIEASSWDNETPTSAAFKAPQSLAPSPHINTWKPSFCNDCTNWVLLSGEHLAYTEQCLKINLKASWKGFKANFDGGISFCVFVLILSLFSSSDSYFWFILYSISNVLPEIAMTIFSCSLLKGSCVKSIFIFL